MIWTVNLVAHGYKTWGCFNGFSVDNVVSKSFGVSRTFNTSALRRHAVPLSVYRLMLEWNFINHAIASFPQRLKHSRNSAPILTLQPRS